MRNLWMKFIVGVAVVVGVAAGYHLATRSVVPSTTGAVISSAIDDDKFDEDMNNVLRELAVRGQTFDPEVLTSAFNRDPHVIIDPSSHANITPMEDGDLYHHAARATLALYANTTVKAKGEGGAWLGAAFVVHPSGIAVTCFHVLCFKEPFVLGACTSDGKKIGVKSILAVFPRQDLAFIQLEGNGFASLPLRENAPAGTQLRVLGHPLRAHFFMVQGLLARYEAVPMEGPYKSPQIQMNLAVQEASGFSGAPVLDVMGNVLGMGQSMRFITQGTETYAIHSALPALVIVSCLKGEYKEIVSDEERRTLLQPPPDNYAIGEGVVNVPLPEGRLIVRYSAEAIRITVLDSSGNVIVVGTGSNSFLQTLPDWAKRAFHETFPNGIRGVGGPAW